MSKGWVFPFPGDPVHEAFPSRQNTYFVGADRCGSTGPPPSSSEMPILRRACIAGRSVSSSADEAIVYESAGTPREQRNSRRDSGHSHQDQLMPPGSI